MKITVSGLVNIETNLSVKSFPINYYPIDFNFFGINNNVGGVGYNIAKALTILGSDINFASIISDDFEGKTILAKLLKDDISKKYIYKNLKATPQSIILFDTHGKRQIYCDLKDIQSYELNDNVINDMLKHTDFLIACNINFNRKLLTEAKKRNIKIATDVHVINNVNDEYNKLFMENADILFLSNELILGKEKDFLNELISTYHNEIIVITMGKQGALVYERKTGKITKFDAVFTDNVVNTVGAGDALLSAFIHFYLKTNEIERSIKLAQTFASIKIQASGASNGFVDEQTVINVYDK